MDDFYGNPEGEVGWEWKDNQRGRALTDEILGYDGSE
jgi:hypothetical protein